MIDLCILRLDSDVLWVRKASGKPEYHLIDIYANSNYQCDSVDMRNIGEWNNATGLYIAASYNRNSIRRNLSLHELHTVVTKRPLLNNDTLSESIPLNTKYHLALIKFLQDVHHFS